MKRQWIVWGIMITLSMILAGDSVTAQLQQVEPLQAVIQTNNDGEHQLYLYDVLTDALTPLTPVYDTRIFCPEIAPDGATVVYKTDNRTSSDRLYVVNIAEGDEREVELRDFVSCARWSPDSTGFVYSIRRSFEDYVVYRYDLPTGARQVLFELETDNPPFLQWSPDGQHLLINSEGDLYTYALAEDDLTRLTETEDSREFFLNWSPAGTVFSFGIRERQRFQDALFLMNVDSGIAQEITTGIASEFGGTYWSPDGAQVAFERVTSGTRTFFDAIYVYDLQQQVIVTDILADGDDNYINEPLWSPDGTGFVYRQFDLSDFTTDLILYEVESNSVRRLTNTPDLAEDGVRWSPTGTQLAFIGFVVDNPGRTKRARAMPDNDQLTIDIGEPDTYLYDLATDTTTQLTDTPNLSDIEVQWSPDGRYLIIRTQRAGSNSQFDLSLINVTTGDVRVMTDFIGNETFVGWLPVVE